MGDIRHWEAIPILFTNRNIVYSNITRSNIACLSQIRLPKNFLALIVINVFCRGLTMNISRLARFKAPINTDGRRLEFNELIVRAARSWNPEYPGREELPRKYASICRTTVILASSQQKSSQKILSEVCRIKGIDESEVISALELLASRIEESDPLFQRDREIKRALLNQTKSLLQRLK